MCAEMRNENETFELGFTITGVTIIINVYYKSNAVHNNIVIMMTMMRITNKLHCEITNQLCDYIQCT